MARQATEAEWLIGAPLGNLIVFSRFHSTERQRRLFNVGLCRLEWDRLQNEDFRRLVEFLERAADGFATDEQLNEAHDSFGSGFRWHLHYPGIRTRLLTVAWMASVPRCTIPNTFPLKSQRAPQLELLRDIFGNPFRPVSIDRDWFTWNDGTVPKLAQTIYDDRRFDLLPILADALEEAGCDHAEILTHCRGPGPHVRGCWVVDLLLGKT